MKPIQIILFDQVVKINSIKLDRYKNNALAVSLMMVWPEDDYESPTRLSVNFAHGQDMESDQLPDGRFFAKSYSEMGMIYAAVLKAGLIEVVGPMVQSEHVKCPVCQLTKLGESMVVGPMPAMICENCCQPLEEENLFVCNKCGQEEIDTPK